MELSLYEFAGGEQAFLALATAHHARCLADPELNHPFSHPDQHPQHVERLAAYWAEVMGGPPGYSRDCGNQAGVVRMHSGNGDLSDLNRRFVACFRAALDDAGLPDDAAFRDAMHAYLDWAVGEITGHPGPDVDVSDDAPMPRWSWDGLQPPPARRTARYRFLDGMGDPVAYGEFTDHATAVAAAADLPDDVDEVQRVEYLGPEGDWRWAGPLTG